MELIKDKGDISKERWDQVLPKKCMVCKAKGFESTCDHIESSLHRGNLAKQEDFYEMIDTENRELELKLLGFEQQQWTEVNLTVE